MNYEEKYNDLLSRIKRMADVQPDVTRAAIESLFPELKESEDERIREALIKYLDALDDNEIRYGVSFKDMRTWLEKQGKNNMGISEATKQELEDNLNKALEKETPEFLNEFLDEQKPQGKSALEAAKEEKVDNQNCIKPADKVEPKFKVKYAGNEYNVLEVKDFLGVTFYGIEDKPNHIDYILPNNCEIVSEQKSAWSEKDDSHIYSITEKLKGKFEKSIVITKFSLEEDLSWLKFLKDRYTWKPSDEQMDALHYVTNFDYGGHKATLVSLYEQLKKLKG